MDAEKYPTYPDVLAHLQKSKDRKLHLLFGNGFSMAYDPSIFSYNALARFVKECKDATIIKLFRIIGSSNFEVIMKNIDLFVQMGKEFMPEANIESKMRPAQLKLKNNLIDAITKLHPECVFNIPEEKSKSCALFLQPFISSGGSIFSTNYDLLLYWVLMRQSDELKNIRDGFLRGDNESLTWESGDQNINYLHGSLPLFLSGVSIIKEEFSGERYLLENIKTRINKNQYPIFVTGGNAEEKLKTISQNRYLSYCLNQLENIGGSLVVIGFNFGEYDTHIIDAINRASKRRKGHQQLFSLYIGYYSDNDKRHFEEISNKFELSQQKIYLFDVKTANIWGNKQ